eukprot:scaffold18000_cov44-Attheya_sp.AAC.1
MDVPLKHSVEKFKEGWEGKAKGMKQIAYERRCIDLTKIDLYSKDGPKNSEGNIIDESFSYKVLLSGCRDFVEEKTLLQHMGEEIGNDQRIKITINRTPKCHPEVAGEGMEYSWAMSKIYIRSVPINKRRTLSQFHEHVNFALSRTEGAKMTKETIQKFSVHGARDFIAAYHVLHADGGGKAHPNGKAHTELTMNDIKKTRRVYRLALAVARPPQQRAMLHELAAISTLCSNVIIC